MKVLVWGGTGQAKVIRPILYRNGHSIIAIFDRNPEIEPPFLDLPLISDLAALERYLDNMCGESLGFVVAIGGRTGRDRVEIGESLLARGLVPLTVVHDRAWVAESAHIGAGSQILGMSAISEEAKVERFCIVNTNASVDHECHLGDGVHIMPGATVAGCVEIGDFSTIGSNATVLPRVQIGANAVIGAGSVVTRDVPDGSMVLGNPARLFNSDD